MRSPTIHTSLRSSTIWNVRRRVALAVVTSLLSFLGSGATLEAQGPSPLRKLYVVSVPEGPEHVAAAQRIGAVSRDVLRRMSHADWREADRRFLGYGEGALEALERARGALEQGRQSYMNLELDQAVTALSEAVQGFDLATEVLEDPTELRDALTLLGASYAFQGDGRQARQVFRRLHVQFPGYELDPNVYPPDVVSAFRKAAPRGRAARLASLRIETDPPGAVVYLDYVPMGRSPIEVGNILPGTHVLRLLRPGARQVVQEVELRPGGKETVSTILTDEEDAQGLADAVAALPEQDFSGFEAPAPLTEVIGILGVDQIGVLRVASEEGAESAHVAFLVFGGNGRRLLRTEAEVPLQGEATMKALEQLIGEGFQRTLVVRQAQDEERVFAAPPPPPPEESVLGKWWFWAAVGGAVAAGGVAAAVFLAKPSEPPSTEIVFEFQR